SKGQKNDFRDAEAIAEAVQRPTMKFVATKTADQLDLQALHRVRERLVSQRTGIINPPSWRPCPVRPSSPPPDSDFVDRRMFGCSLPRGHRKTLYAWAR